MCVYRLSDSQLVCPEIKDTSGIDSPASKSLLIPSCRRSCRVMSSNSKNFAARVLHGWPWVVMHFKAPHLARGVPDPAVWAAVADVDGFHGAAPTSFHSSQMAFAACGVVNLAPGLPWKDRTLVPSALHTQQPIG